MKYDMEKIRVACLGLMGWKNERDIVWFSPDGETHYDMDGCRATFVPDPTRSFDEALPLVEKYKICLYSPGCSYAGGEYGWRDDVWGAEMCDAAYYALDENFRYDVLCSGRRFEADAAPLAICLCALAASGRNPKDFEVSDGQ